MGAPRAALRSTSREQADKNKHGHRRAGFVLVLQQPAPISGEFRLDEIRGLVNFERLSAPAGTPDSTTASTISATAANTSLKCRIFLGTSITIPATTIVYQCEG